jgi:hypothetical protein
MVFSFLILLSDFDNYDLFTTDLFPASESYEVHKAIPAGEQEDNEMFGDVHHSPRTFSNVKFQDGADIVQRHQEGDQTNAHFFPI